MTRGRWWRRAGGLLSLVVLGTGGCDAAEGAPPIAAPDWCAEAPVTTWHNFGEGFLLDNCQPCHASTAPDRHEAPAAVVFDSQMDVREHRGRMVFRATGLAPSMPPAGGISAADRARFHAWLACDPALYVE